MATGETVDLRWDVEAEPVPGETKDASQSSKTLSPAPETPAFPPNPRSACAAPTNHEDAPFSTSADPMDQSRQDTVAGSIEHDSTALLSRQREDIDHIMANVDTLLQDMRTVKASIDYIKFQQKTFADHEATGSPTDLTRNIAALTESVSRVSTKVNDVDGLKLELETMKSRIQLLEETIESGQLRSIAPSEVTRLGHTRSKFVRNGSNESQEIPSSSVERDHTEPPLSHSRLPSLIPPSQKIGDGGELSDLLSQAQQMEVSEDEVTPEETFSKWSDHESVPLKR